MFNIRNLRLAFAGVLMLGFVLPGFCIMLALTMACNAGEWFFERLYWTIAKATGVTPIAVYNSMHNGTVTFVVPCVWTLISTLRPGPFGSRRTGSRASGRSG